MHSRKMAEKCKNALDNGKNFSGCSGPFSKGLNTLSLVSPLSKLSTYDFWDSAIEFQKQPLADVLQNRSS